MHFRQSEYEALGLSPRWLDEARARNAYEYAVKYCDPHKYALNENTTKDVKRHDVSSVSVAKAWVRQHWNAEGTVQIVYSESMVCVLSSRSFVEHWENIFRPCRDDAVILHNLDGGVFFYSHEDELEIATRLSRFGTEA